MSWKILRILTANVCNYRCLYCHNEGQRFGTERNFLSFEQFERVMKKVVGSTIREIRFSGGEPLINKSTIDMIEWVDRNTDFEVGFATNGSLTDEALVRRLAKTRVMVTLHFPATEAQSYFKITGGDKKNFNRCVELFDSYAIDYSFNCVLYPATIDNLDDVINYSVARGKRLKLLPYLEQGFKNFSANMMATFDERLKNFCGQKFRDEVNGITWWKFPNGAAIKLLDSPCYERNIFKCRAYGEIRLLPDLELQPCIFGQSVKFDDADNFNDVLDALWDKFQACPPQ